MTEGAEDELRQIVDELRDAKEAVLRQVFERALERGELREGVDGKLLMATLVGSLHHSTFAMCRVPSRPDVQALVDLLLYGAMTTKGRKAARDPRALEPSLGRASESSKRKSRRLDG